MNTCSWVFDPTYFEIRIMLFISTRMVQRHFRKYFVYNTISLKVMMAGHGGIEPAEVYPFTPRRVRLTFTHTMVLKENQVFFSQCFILHEGRAYTSSRRFVRPSVCPSVRQHLDRDITLKLQEVSTRNFVGKQI